MPEIAELFVVGTDGVILASTHASQQGKRYDPKPLPQASATQRKLPANTPPKARQPPCPPPRRWTRSSTTSVRPPSTSSTMSALHVWP
ncbi:hypothetical protein PSEUDO8Z_170262 [Pseudomonas sp. 8Z]|nr:hypothetical protein PSEUDO8Z_170262 [Pseudomonas sp. 8Z]